MPLSFPFKLKGVSHKRCETVGEVTPMSSFERLAGYPLQYFDFSKLKFICHISDSVMKGARLGVLKRSQGKSLYSSDPK